MRHGGGGKYRALTLIAVGTVGAAAYWSLATPGTATAATDIAPPPARIAVAVEEPSQLASTITPAEQLDRRTGEGLIATAVADDVPVFDRPDGRMLWRLENPTRHGSDLTLAIVAGAETEDEWLPVHVPLRPNGTTGWVRAADVGVTWTPLRIEIDIDTRVLRLFELERLLFEATVAVGTAANPTPRGVTYVTDLLAADEHGPYGPAAFGLAMHSDSLTEYAGGPAQVGLHGTNRPDLLGQRASAGCIRVDNATITALAELIPLGTPVLIS